ncbi:MAG: NAD(P)-dependent oxidoreductase [Solirubrobacterales bacterium]|nr:NAD(P)-dependent oxidoreductase [Solirubrobacterales bacterium]
MARPVLVLGGHGFLGRQVCAVLRGAGQEAVAAGRSAEPRVDLTEPATIVAALRDLEPSSVICAAGLSSSGAATVDPSVCLRTNVTGIFNLLEAISRERPACHLTLLSTAVLYAPSRSPLTEESPTEAGSIYAASKLAAEVLCRQYAAGGLSIAMLRSFNLIGPGQPAEQAPGEFTRAAVAAHREGRSEATIRVRDPQIRRDFTDVRDAAAAVAAVAGRGLAGTFNLCSGRTVSLAELAALTSEALDGSEPFELRLEASLAPRSGDPETMVGDPSRLQEATGWSAGIDVRDSVADLVAGLGAV